MGQPHIDYYDHPVFHPNRLRLETPAMKRIGEEVHRWLWTGATGGAIIGAARVGKTTALRALVSQLRTRGNEPIPSHYVTIPNRDQRTILSIFRQLCLSAKLRVTPRDRADHLADRFVYYIADRAVEADCQYAVLVVDEMQRLWPAQFNPFAELYDKLSLLDINLTVLFVGNDQECQHLFEQIEQPAYAHIRGRFFTHSTAFPGLTTKEQMKGCLAQYDHLRYPADGPTYTAYFLPDAVQDGWRLTVLSGAMWRVFREYQKNYHITSWGMQYFTAAVNTLLIDFLPRYGVEDVDDELLHECIRISGLVPDLVQRAG